MKFQSPCQFVLVKRNKKGDLCQIDLNSACLVLMVKVNGVLIRRSVQPGSLCVLGVRRRVVMSLKFDG